MKSKRLTLIFALLVFTVPVMAILNGQGLDRILRDVKSELRNDWQLRQNEQDRLQQSYEDQHSRMLDIIKDCNELSMSLYLQKKEYTFDLSYALQRVSQEYKDFNKSRTPYDIIVRDLDLEIDRYARFMEALRRLPPELQNLELVPDSLSYHNDSLDTFLSHSGSSLEREVIAIAMADSIPSPFVLSTVGQQDRDSCLFYAGELLRIYAENRATVLADSLHYQEAYLRLKESYDYATSRYRLLQEEIFTEGQIPWWTLLSKAGTYWKLAAQEARAQYSLSALADPDFNLDTAESRSLNTYLFVTVSLMLFMLLICWLVAAGVLWLACRFIKPMRENISREKRPFFALILGMLIYLLLFSNTAGVSNASVALAMKQIATFFWLLLAIVAALLVRVDPEKIRKAFRLYLPLIFTALVVIVCRVSYVPNLLMNILFPPVLLVIFVWQLLTCLIGGKKAEKSDKFICWVSFVVIGLATVLAICGYIFVALMLLVWWYFQLAAILTLVAIGHLMTRYRENFMTARVEKATEGITLVSGADKESLLFKATWFYDLIRHVVIPCLALASIPLCIKHSMDVFNFEDLFHQLYETPFMQVPGQDGEVFFRISLQSIVRVGCLFFIFRYISRALHALWQRGRYNTFMRKNKRQSVRANEINLSLGNSLISVAVWFLYIVCIVYILNIPTGSLGLAIGGLSAGIGLALKDIINNFIYGIQLMSGRLRVGDWIECEGVRGQVVDINYQSTQVETEEATTVSFLNATLFSKSFTNLTKGNSYQFLNILVGVAYGTDIEKVRTVLEKAMEVMKTKDKYGRDVVDPRFGIYIRFGEFSESSVDIAIKQYVLAAEHIKYRDKAKEVIYNALNENGITIPFPQRDLHIIKES